MKRLALLPNCYELAMIYYFHPDGVDDQLPLDTTSASEALILAQLHLYQTYTGNLWRTVGSFLIISQHFQNIESKSVKFSIKSVVLVVNINSSQPPTIAIRSRLLVTLIHSVASQNYKLRHRTHNRSLPDRAGHLSDANFISRMIFKDTY